MVEGKQLFFCTLSVLCLVYIYIILVTIPLIVTMRGLCEVERALCFMAVG